MKLSFFVLVLSVVAFAIGSCATDAAVHEEDLLGEWKVVFALRNGKTTELVNGATFAFDDKGNMNTDFPSVNDSGPFTLEEPLLIHHGKSEVLYTLNNLTSDSMQLAFDLQGLNFVLDLVRQPSKK
jgi:hypothetical protein